jgi:hypothetical protein
LFQKSRSLFSILATKMQPSLSHKVKKPFTNSTHSSLEHGQCDTRLQIKPACLVLMEKITKFQSILQSP